MSSNFGEAAMKPTQAEVVEYIGDLASELANYARKNDLHHIAYCLEMTVADAAQLSHNQKLRRPNSVLH